MLKYLALAGCLTIGQSPIAYAEELHSAQITLCAEEETCPADIAAFVGDLNADTIVIYLQGGPVERVETDLLQVFAEQKLENVLTLVPFQAQTRPAADYESREISFDQAKIDAQESSNIAARVIRSYVESGRDVTVLGISYGAFLAQQALVDQGPIANDYVIAVGRITMPNDVWQSFSAGQPLGFIDGVTPIPVAIEEAGMGGSTPAADINMTRLAAGLAYHRYEETLATTDLSSVTYIYGTNDEQVGALSPSEIAFLRRRGADIFEIDGGHGDGAWAALSGLLNRLLKRHGALP